jgi:prolipoprotein diacylglyceryltransferase
MAGVVYFATYQLALVLFVALTRRLLRGSPARNRHALVLALAYLFGMYYAAHALYFPIIQRSLTNAGAAGFWRWVEANRDAVPSTAMVWELFRGGGGLWGGPWFVLLAALGFIVVARLPLEEKQRVADALAVSLPFALALCKVGCFAVGCCHGREGHGPPYVTNTWGSPNTGCFGKSCFPTQLLDLGWYLVVGAFTPLLVRDAASAPRRAAVFHHAACAAQGLLWLTGFLVPSLLPFFAAAALCSAALLLLLGRLYLASPTS